MRKQMLYQGRRDQEPRRMLNTPAAGRTISPNNKNGNEDLGCLKWRAYQCQKYQTFRVVTAW
ncbi:hypothetical protein PISMIDRAFT_689323 [Pisolithus microcarpus 441]|uniref:Uncharacterized protein n=1 Tax=Pisolithus microcarpus 441 TaxID=765257 RepID=A0A0C9Y6S8_9AGAM|nr:hypothetical protein PISMIDRAFT_689323 [Pisolithus microcarpus 441]